MQKQRSRESREAEKQRSRKSKEAGKTKSRKAEKQRSNVSREAGKAEKQCKQRSRKAEKQKSRKSEKQESIEPGTPKKNRNLPRKKITKINAVVCQLVQSFNLFYLEPSSGPAWSLHLLTND